jgi:DNA polymerase V
MNQVFSRFRPSVPLLGKPVPAGFPSPADDYVQAHISLDQHLMPHPEATFLMRVAGDSMRGAGIQDGDLLVVDRALNAAQGDVVIAVHEGDFMVKQFSSVPEGILLRSVNGGHRDILVTTDQMLVIWGVVRWAIHEVLPCRPASH